MQKLMKQSALALSIGVFSSFLLFSHPDTILAEDSNQNNDVFYVAKFVCGSIEDDDGPLRPGHYDTNISILNKLTDKTSFYWNASLENGHVSHSTLITLDSMFSTGLTCKDIKRVSGEEGKNLSQGFVLITVPKNYNPAQPNQMTTNLSNSTGLEVQVFYTANALDTLPHEVVYEKISFYILQDETGKIPPEMIKNTLDITLKSEINSISNTELKIKKILAQNYGIPEDQLTQIHVRIKDVSIGVGSLIDDHAISLSILKPQTSPGDLK
jgi:peroxiredoxin family protein